MIALILLPRRWSRKRSPGCRMALSLGIGVFCSSPCCSSRSPGSTRTADPDTAAVHLSTVSAPVGSPTCSESVSWAARSTPSTTATW